MYETISNCFLMRFMVHNEIHCPLGAAYNPGKVKQGLSHTSYSPQVSALTWTLMKLFSRSHIICVFCFHMCVADPPRIITHPQELNNILQGKSSKFIILATGTDPLSYWWQWKPAEQEGETDEWQPCDSEWFDGATLTIPTVQKSNEGHYCCVISNCAGASTSNPAKLSVGKNPICLYS